MTDPTERLAEILEEAIRECTNPKAYAAHLVATEGWGRREDQVREFAEWYYIVEPIWAESLPEAADRYLASLAAKEEDG